jgi:hypothetical protein
MAMTSFDEWKNKEDKIDEVNVLQNLRSMGKFGTSVVKGLGSNVAGKLSGFLGGKLKSTDAKNLATEVLGLMGPAVLTKAEEDPNFVADFAAAIKIQLPTALMKLKQAAK